MQMTATKQAVLRVIQENPGIARATLIQRLSYLPGKSRAVAPVLTALIEAALVVEVYEDGGRGRLFLSPLGTEILEHVP